MELLERPTKTKAKQIYIGLIGYAFSQGFDRQASNSEINLMDHEVYDIAKKYGHI